MGGEKKEPEAKRPGEQEPRVTAKKQTLVAKWLRYIGIRETGGRKTQPNPWAGEFGVGIMLARVTP